MILIAHIPTHKVKSDDLNHHGTLFAEKTAMWFVEADFIAATSLTSPESVVLMNILSIRLRQLNDPILLLILLQAELHGFNCSLQIRRT